MPSPKFLKPIFEAVEGLTDDAVEALMLAFKDAPDTAATRRAARQAAESARLTPSSFNARATVPAGDDLATTVQRMYDEGASREEVDAFMRQNNAVYSDPAAADASFAARPNVANFITPPAQSAGSPANMVARLRRAAADAQRTLAARPSRRAVEQRITDPVAIADETSLRRRAEARARMAAEPNAAARRDARAVYTEQPIVINQDPELAQFSLRPGNVQSVTEQAAELGIPVTGRVPFFTQHRGGYSSSWGGNAPDPTTFTAEYRDRVPGLSVRTLGGDDFPVGAGAMPLLGDASAGNRDVISVMGTDLVDPVSLLAGGGYGLQEGALGHRGVWSSGAGVVEGQAKAIQDWRNANEGQDVLGIHVNMGATGSDFSHQTAAVLANLIPNLGLSGDELRAIDDYIRAGAGGLPNFEGFAENPALGLFDILMRPGSERKRITQRLGNVTKEAQAAGVPPHLGALARLAVADRDLRLAPQGSAGFGVVRFDPTNFLRIDPALLSSTKRQLFENSNEYGGVLGGLAELLRADYAGVLTGDFLGQTERLIPAEIPFRPIFDRAAQVTSKGDPTTTGMRFTSFKTDPNPIVTITPEIQDNIGEYLYRTNRFDRFGYADGGRVDFAVRR